MALFAEKIRAEILDGCLNDYKTYLSGYYGGYQVVLQLAGNEYLLRMDVASDMDPGNIRLNEFVSKLAAENKNLKRVALDGATLALFLKKPFALKKLPGVIDECAQPVFEFLRTGFYRSACSNCQSTSAAVKLYEVNGYAEYLCEACAAARRSGLEANQVSAKAQKSNFFPGLAGAILGSLAGIALWVLVYYLGYIAGLAGLLMAVLALKGYEKFGGALDVKGVITCIVVLILAVIFANKLSWSLEAYSALKEYGWTFGECFRELGYILEESDLTGSYYGDLAIGLILTAACTVGTIISAFRKSTGKFSFVEK